MSQDTTCAKGEAIENPGAFARHADACDVCERGAADPETAENGGFRTSDLRMDEIRAAVRQAPAATLDATLAKHAYEPTDADTRESAAAKALIQAKSGGREAYATVFGECSHEGCSYGANGFRADACKSHGGEPGPAAPAKPEPEPETPESGGSEPETSELPSEAEVTAALIREGCEPAKAPEIAAYTLELIENGVSVEAAVEAAQAKAGL